MGFDSKKFLREQLQPRTAEVRVEALSPWFGDGVNPVFVVQGLNYEQVERARLAAANTATLSELIAGLQSGDSSKKAKAIRQAMGYGDDPPENMVKRINYLVHGSVDPVIDEEMAVKIAHSFAVEFTMLTDEILKLTGLGYEPGKRKSSGKTPQSEPA